MSSSISYFSNKLRAQGVTLYFPLTRPLNVDLTEDFITTPAVHVAGDTQVSKDGGAFANTSNGFAYEGNGIYSLALTASEMDADVVLVTVVDSAAKVWKDHLLQVETLRSADGVLRQELAAAGGASTITLDSGASAVNDFYKGCLVAIVGGTGAGQCRAIRSYVGATQVATVGRAWATNPDATSLYVILPGGEVQLDPYGVDDVWDESEGAEPSSAIASNATFRAILQHFKRWAFNRATATNAARTTYKDNSVDVLATQTFSSDGVTSDRGKAL